MEQVSKVYAPWTPPQVAAIVRWQASGTVHEYTCPNGHGALGVMQQHLICAGCDYRQDWVHQTTIDYEPALLVLTSRFRAEAMLAAMAHEHVSYTPEGQLVKAFLDDLQRALAV